MTVLTFYPTQITKTTYCSRTGNEERPTVVVDQCVEMPFAIFDNDPDPDTRYRNAVNITHVPSGFRLVNCASKAIAYDLLTKLQSITIDWSIVDPRDMSAAANKPFFKFMKKYDPVWQVGQIVGSGK